MNYFIYKGKDSRLYDELVVNSLPPITKASKRTEVIEIEGRDGDIINEKGYMAYDKAIKITLLNFNNIDEIMAWLEGDGELITSDEPDKVYKCKITEGIDLQRLYQFREATIQFHAQPFKYLRGEKTINKDDYLKSASGETIEISDANGGVKEFIVYGNSKQDGTPGPNNPCEIISIGNELSLKINEKTIQINLENKELCKIGNIHDEINIISGILTKRIKKEVLNGNNTWTMYDTAQGKLFRATYITDAKKDNNYSVKCTHYNGIPYENSGNVRKNGDIYLNSNNYYLDIIDNRFSNVDEFKNWLLTNDVALYYLLETPETIQLDKPTVVLFNGANSISLESELKTNIKLEYSTNEEIEVLNYGNIYARPKMKIYGNDKIRIYLNDNQKFEIEMGNEEYITIDCAEMEAYKDTVNNLKNRIVTGNYDDFILKPGKNKIHFEGGIEKFEICNYLRWI